MRTAISRSSEQLAGLKSLCLSLRQHRCRLTAHYCRFSDHITKCEQFQIICSFEFTSAISAVVTQLPCCGNTTRQHSGRRDSQPDICCILKIVSALFICVSIPCCIIEILVSGIVCRQSQLRGRLRIRTFLFNLRINHGFLEKALTIA